MENIWRVEFLDHVIKNDLPNLPKSARILILKAIDHRLKVDPIAFGKPLRHSLSGSKRLRVSTYRIIYKVDVKARMVTVTAIDHRKDVYG